MGECGIEILSRNGRSVLTVFSACVIGCNGRHRRSRHCSARDAPFQTSPGIKSHHSRTVFALNMPDLTGSEGLRSDGSRSAETWVPGDRVQIMYMLDTQCQVSCRDAQVYGCTSRCTCVHTRCIHRIGWRQRPRGGRLTHMTLAHDAGPRRRLICCLPRQFARARAPGQPAT